MLLVCRRSGDGGVGGGGVARRCGACADACGARARAADRAFCLFNMRARARHRVASRRCELSRRAFAAASLPSPLPPPLSPLSPLSPPSPSLCGQHERLRARNASKQSGVTTRAKVYALSKYSNFIAMCLTASARAREYRFLRY